MIEVHNISKAYGEVKALNDLSFEVEAGEIFGLIGPDGAGKTTQIRILTTLILPDSGFARVLGLDVVKDFKKLRKLFGYMPGRFSLYEDLSVEENLSLFAAIFGTTIDENYELVKDIYAQIEPFKKRRAGKLSGGMKQKLALSCAMIHKPQVIFLDEPTTGVDAVSRKEFWTMLQNLKANGITILVSTPYMDEAGLCDRVALIQNGEIMKINTPDGIVESYRRNLYAISASNKYRLLEDLRRYPSCHSVFLFGENVHYTDRSPEADMSGIRTYLEKRAHASIRLEEIKPGIEDCFMELMAEKTLDR
jgi:ABC-type multidrug transport system ATPase subunit